jgi:hypothetical protein
MSYQSDGAHLYSQAYSAALGASTTGVVATRTLVSAAMAIASGIGGDTLQQIVVAVETVESDAAVGAQWGALLGPLGAGVGAIIGAVVGLVQAFPAHGDEGDFRPQIIQLWDKIPPVTDDVSVADIATAMGAFIGGRYESQAYPNGFGPNSPYTACDTACANGLWQAFVSKWAEQGNGPEQSLKLAVDAVGRADIWSTRPCSMMPPGSVNIYGSGMCSYAPGVIMPGTEAIYAGNGSGWTGLSVIGYAAVLQWNDQKLYSYLVGMRLSITKWEQTVPGVSGPLTDAIKLVLEDQIGYVAKRVPALQAQLPGGHPQPIVITIPKGGWGHIGPQPTQPTKPTSTATKVAVGAGAAGVAAAVAVTLVAWAKGETLSFVLKKMWKSIS